MTNRTWLLANPSQISNELQHLLINTPNVQTSLHDFAQCAATLQDSDDLIIINARQLGEIVPQLRSAPAKKAHQQNNTNPGLQLNPARMTASIGKQQTATLTSREFQILSVICEHAPDRASREQIVTTVWGQKPITVKAFDVHLVSLRRKLQALGIKIEHVAPCTYGISAPATDLIDQAS